MGAVVDADLIKIVKELQIINRGSLQDGVTLEHSVAKATIHFIDPRTNEYKRIKGFVLGKSLPDIVIDASKEMILCDGEKLLNLDDWVKYIVIYICGNVNLFEHDQNRVTLDGKLYAIDCGSIIGITDYTTYTADS